jgi:molybdopterin converting factor subunit 1
MKVRVLFFATAREQAGTAEIVLDAPEGGRVEALLDLLCERHPALKRLRPSSFVAVNREYAPPGTVLKEGDEVAWIPPVSGG